MLERARIEHNIQVISKLYMNITFVELGKFLGIPKEKAEQIVADAVSDKRLNAVLDQENELVEFEDESNRQATFNEQIQAVCENVDSLMRDICKQHPALQKQYDNHVF